MTFAYRAHRMTLTVLIFAAASFAAGCTSDAGDEGLFYLIYSNLLKCNSEKK